MAKGETTFDASKQQVKKYESTPLPIKEYEGKLLPGLQLKKAAGAGKLPYVFGMIECLNSAVSEGGKNRKISKMFFLNTSPDKDGVAGVNRQDGIVAYSKAVGANLKCGTVSAQKAIGDTGEMVGVRILDPNQALRYLEGTAGQLFSFKSKLQPDQNGVKWGAIDFFIEADGGDEDGDEDSSDEDSSDDDVEDDGDGDDEADDDEDESEADDVDEDDDDEGDDESEDEEPAPKSKVKQGPAGKVGKKKKK